MFWPLVVVSSAASAAMFGAVYAYWRYWPNRRHEKRVLDLKALRDLLLYHVDDLEDIMAALKSRHDADLRAVPLSPHWCRHVCAFFMMLSLRHCNNPMGMIADEYQALGLMNARPTSCIRTAFHTLISMLDACMHGAEVSTSADGRVNVNFAKWFPCHRSCLDG